MRLLLGLLCVLLATATMAQVPNTFQSGTTALAAEVNENFSDLDTRVSTNTTNITTGEAVIDQLFATIDFTAVLGEADAVAVALCPVDSIPTSAQCDCDGDGTTRNFGVLFACQLAIDGGVAACFPEGFLFNPALLDPLATVVAVCTSATLVNGDPALVSPFGFGKPALGVIGGLSKLAAKDIDVVVQEAQNAVSAHRNALLLKK